MQTKTVLFIILAAILALLIVLFQYYFKAKKKGKLTFLLAFLRFLGVFAVLVLLINPKFSKTSYTLEKPNLAIVVDNSSSVKESADTLKILLNAILQSEEIANRFKIDTYRFGDNLTNLDSLSFSENQTNISKALSLLEDTYARRKAAMVLLSDGNQTIGQDYTFSTKANGPSIYTVTVGDTTKYEDLSIGNINANTYAFLNNKYPLETFVSYQGSGSVKANVTIKVNGISVFKESISLSKSNNIKSIKTLLDAKTIGLKRISVSVTPLPTERVISNNTRETSVEVIDEKTNIALISEILHPDLGALKKSIESNEQRMVTILNFPLSDKALEDADLFILYQPNASFRKVFEFIGQRKSNVLMITGTQTDYVFLNAIQNDFQIESGYPVQEVFGGLNKGFPKFDISNFDLTDFPPLLSDAGPLVTTKSNEILLNMKVKGLDMSTPLFSVFDNGSIKKGLLIGEGLWKWRMQTFRNTGDFSNFDAFLGKLMRYLNSSENKDRLNVVYNRSYEGSSTALISATYFDQAYVFDSNAVLSITVVNKETERSTTIPMVLKNGYFEADLTNLASGSYSFKVSVKNENYSKSGDFTISDFDVEKQFVSSNYRKMELLASNTGGTHYFPSKYQDLLKELSTNNDFVPTQKSTENIVSLVDFRILLAVIAFAFAAEWFIRKYNGLI